MNKLLKLTLTVLFTIIILLGFAMPLNPVGNWQQQFFPDIGNRQISDIFFLDSLNGWAVTPYTTMNDTVFVLRTTNKGDNWSIQFTGTAQFPGMKKIKFINAYTGYCCGNFLYNGSTQLVKTTNGGTNWLSLNTPDPFFVIDDMYILNEDTIWLAVSSSASGGVFFTSNGGVNWIRQLIPFGLNPDHIYMYNSRIGFAGQFTAAPRLFKTTNSGINWFSLNDTGFTDMYFADSLTGWMSMGWMKKTTNGGLNWTRQTLPFGGNIITSGIRAFDNINKDTIWGVGGALLLNLQFRGILLYTSNGGNNWLFQLPDTAIHIGEYYFVDFVNKRNGWAYNDNSSGIHTTTGGNDTFFTPVVPVSTEIPNEFKLFQNYPNPFNPVTNIGFRIAGFGFVTLKIFDITGREISELINKELRPGIYNIDWNASAYSSGVYFYKLTAAEGKEVFTETKKMILIK